MSGVEHFPETVVDGVVSALDAEHDLGSFWVEFEHMEANRFDLAWQQSSSCGSLLGS